MEPLTTPDCTGWHGALAVRVLGGLSAGERTALDAHLEGCARCRATHLEMSETRDLLGHVDPRAVRASAAVPAPLTERILGDLHRGAHHERRRRVARRATAVLAAAMVAGVVVVGAHQPSPPSLQRTLDLAGRSTVHARAVLFAQSWGTSVTLNERGLPGGQVYTVAMRTASGKWWVAGTYRAVTGQPVRATMACAVAFGAITGLRVSNSAGATVLSSYHEGGHLA